MRLYKTLTPCLIVLFLMTGCQQNIIPTTQLPTDNSAEVPAYIANPAAVYCAEIMGYAYEIVTAEDGSQSGVCVMPDGESCPQWAFYAGECGADYSYCAQEGLKIETRSDGEDPYAINYGICVNHEGNEVLSIFELLNNQ